MVKNSGTGFCQGAGPVLGRFGLPGPGGLPRQKRKIGVGGCRCGHNRAVKCCKRGTFEGRRRAASKIGRTCHLARFCVACLPAVRPFASSPGHLQRECGQGVAAPSACARIGGVGRLPSAVQHGGPDLFMATAEIVVGRLPSAVQHLRGIRTAGRRKAYLPIPFVRKRLPHRHRRVRDRRKTYPLPPIPFAGPFRQVSATCQITTPSPRTKLESSTRARPDLSWTAAV